MSFSREISYTLPDSGSPSRIGYFDESSLAVIVTHPWGPLGGNMQNSVVLNVVQFFQRLKVTTMRFDFCGMQIGRGYSQIDQVKEAANVLLKGKFLSSDEQTHPKHILLVGYSYGSIICASATASIPECIGVIWIAPPLGVRRWLYLFAGNKHLAQAHKREDMPQLMIMGSNDNFTSVEDFERVVKAMPKDSTTSVVLEGSDHFFGRTAKDLLAAIVHGMKVFGQLDGLEYLNLGHNALTELPSGIGLLTNLQILLLCGKGLSGLPTEVPQLANLRELEVSRNLLKRGRNEYPEETTWEIATGDGTVVASGDGYSSLHAQLHQLDIPRETVCPIRCLHLDDFDDGGLSVEITRLGKVDQIDADFKAQVVRFICA
ncbi:MAG: hypothetical protein SGBAC_002988 [Bacillariaceae sp.]